MNSLERELTAWKEDLVRRRACSIEAAERLSQEAAASASELVASGLQEQEAVLIALQRILPDNAELADTTRIAGLQLWGRMTRRGPSSHSSLKRTDNRFFAAALILGVVLSQLPGLLGLDITTDAHLVTYLYYLGYYSILPLTLWYLLRQSLPSKVLIGMALAYVLPFIVGLVPSLFTEDTRILSIIHLPISLWLLSSLIHTGGKWRDTDAQMRFLRYTGEVVIYTGLIWIGGMVISMLMIGLFDTVGADVETFFLRWVFTWGFPLALVVAGYLVEMKRQVSESLASILARIFSPLFLLALGIFCIFSLGNVRLLMTSRDMLILADAVQLLVLALVIFTMAVREEGAPVGFQDHISCALIILTLLLDVIAMVGILSRLLEYGLSPNRLAATGINLILFANLLLTGWHYLRFLRKKVPFSSVLNVQRQFLLVFFLWSYFVAVVFPLIF